MNRSDKGEQSKIKLEEFFFKILVQTFAFILFFSFYAFNPSVCLVFLFLFVLTCLSSLGLHFCIFKMHVRLLECVFK